MSYEYNLDKSFGILKGESESDDGVRNDTASVVALV